MKLLRKKKLDLLKIALLMAWVLLVLYPNPGKLAASVYRLKNPPVAPYRVTELALPLQGLTPGEIQEFVYANIPYRYDWEVYNMPWYFPTLDEALYSEYGDCKARFLLFASLLEEMEIPYRKNISLTHIWVDYEGKPENRLENIGETLIIVDENGRVRLSVPRADLARSSRSLREGFWETMPLDKKWMLLAGFPAVFGIFHLRQLHISKPPIKLSKD